MRKFLIRTGAFLLVATIIVVLVITWCHKVIDRNATFDIPLTASKAIMGHSHPQFAYDDSLISDFSNLANSGESYFYTYWKARKILEQNTHIDTIFLEFTNNQIDAKMNDWIWGNEFMLTMYDTYGPFVGLQGNQLLMFYNFKSYVRSLSASLKGGIDIIKAKKFDYRPKIGGYKDLVREKTDSLLDAMKNDPHSDTSSLEVSKHNIKYLKKLVDLCEAKNIKVYLIRSPLHAKYPGFNNEKQLQQILNDEFPGLDFLDLRTFPLLNSDFADLEHLNYQGARKFSVFFNDLLQRGLLSSENKQEFINRSIAASDTTNLPPGE